MAEVLRYDNVDISYNGQTIVRDINFTLNQGEILGIVGESGSGKSTIIKAAMGLLGPEGLVTRGDIWYDNQNNGKCDINLVDISDKARRDINGPKIGMIFQYAGSSFCPIRTIGSQLYEIISEHKATQGKKTSSSEGQSSGGKKSSKESKAEFHEQVVEMLTKLGFEEPERILKSYPFELSGGMQQRIGIAAAMLLNPSVLLADEPTSALDVTIQKQVVEEMLMVRETFGTSIVLVTHNIGVIGAMSDKVIVVNKGKIVEYGETKEVLNNPKDEYTRKLMAAVPRLNK